MSTTVPLDAAQGSALSRHQRQHGLWVTAAVLGLVFPITGFIAARHNSRETNQQEG